MTRIPLFTSVLIFAFLSLQVNGQPQWTNVSKGMYGGQVMTMLSVDDMVYAGTLGGVFVSNNDGATWSKANTGLDEMMVNSMAVCGGKVFMATNGGSRMFFTADKGTTWITANNGLPSNAIVSLVAVGNSLFGLGNNGLLYQSSDFGMTWSELSTGLGFIGSLAAADGNLYVSSNSEVYISLNGGGVWSLASTGLTSSTIFHLSASSSYVLANTNSGAYFSNNYGITWKYLFLPNGYYSLLYDGNVMYTGDVYNTFRSIDQGNSWLPMNQLPNGAHFVTHENQVMAATNFGVYQSADHGATWNSINEGLTNTRVTKLLSVDEGLFASTGIGVFYSQDGGNVWTAKNSGLPLNVVISMTASSNYLMASSIDGIYRSEKSGDSWSRVLSSGIIHCFAKNRNRLYAGGENGIFISDNDGSSWSLLNGLRFVSALAVKGDTLFAASYSVTGAIQYEGGCYASIDEGTSWIRIQNGIPEAPAPFITFLVPFDNRLFAGTQNYGTFETIDNGAHWEHTYNGLIPYPNTNYALAIEPYDKQLFLATLGGVFLSIDSAKFWSAINEGLPVLTQTNGLSALTGFDQHIYAGSEASGVWKRCIYPAQPVIKEIIEAPNSVTLISSSENGNEWFLDGSPIPGATDSEFSPKVSGNYSVRVSISGCESQISESVLFEYIPRPQIIMPNVFTPNEDSFNALLKPLKYDYIESAFMRITDRWGKEVYTTRDLLSGWDGGDCPSSVYYYFINYFGVNGDSGSDKGWLQLIR